ncbi:alpha/beta hydrolase [Allorhizobium ampelinum]|uniref:alpha/beta hydrolase n=1 Tax=Allorhizobium ampelinum TaxID=3025782 RepID=UPI001F1CC109|nr:alpha/beta hydrolase [Allorhizobium ampelinum]
MRAAQIGHDLGIGQGIGLFSWPSRGRVRNYTADEAASEASRYLLADFIADFVSNTQQKEVNIIAHSMGCRCLIGALEVLSNGRKSVLKQINQVILAAADVDARIMSHQGEHIIGRCKRITSCASDMDTALKISGWLHDHPRVGTTPPTFVLKGMDTVVVNDNDLGDFSHGYIATSRTILNDIFAVLKHNRAPHERFALEAVSMDGLSFWRIKT